MTLPLQGIRILDNAIVQAGTFPGRLLADFGAEMIRVENYPSPDLARNYPFIDGVPPRHYWEAGGTYHEQHRNKQWCVGLNVKHPQGREFYLRLVSVVDIVLDNHPPGVMDALRLDYEHLRAINPDVIYITSSGYGYGGPYSEARSYGMMTETMCGSGWLNGYPGEGPRRGQIPLTDHPTTYHGAFLAMAALIQRRRTGRGIWLDLSQYEAAINVFGDLHLAEAMGASVPARIGSREPRCSFSGCFRCRGIDEWIAIAVDSHAAWTKLCELTGVELAGQRDIEREPLSDTEREFVAIGVRDWTLRRSKQAAFRRLANAGVPAGSVNNMRDLLLDEHLAQRGFFWLVEHAPRQGVGRRAWPGASSIFSETPAGLRSRAPMLGEHNRDVATQMLGYAEEEYLELEETGAVGSMPLAAAVMPLSIAPQLRTRLPAGAYGAARELDAAWIDRLRTRFGDGYGRDGGDRH